MKLQITVPELAIVYPLEVMDSSLDDFKYNLYKFMCTYQNRPQQHVS